MSHEGHLIRNAIRWYITLIHLWNILVMVFWVPGWATWIKERAIATMLNLQNGISGWLRIGTCQGIHIHCSGTSYSRQVSLPFTKWSLHMRVCSLGAQSHLLVASTHRRQRSGCQHPPTSAIWFARKPVQLVLSTLHKPLGAVVRTTTYWRLQKLLRNWFNICLYGPFCQPRGFHALINSLSKRLTRPPRKGSIIFLFCILRAWIVDVRRTGASKPLSCDLTPTRYYVR